MYVPSARTAARALSTGTSAIRLPGNGGKQRQPWNRIRCFKRILFRDYYQGFSPSSLCCTGPGTKGKSFQARFLRKDRHPCAGPHTISPQTSGVSSSTEQWVEACSEHSSRILINAATPRPPVSPVTCSRFSPNESSRPRTDENASFRTKRRLILIACPATSTALRGRNTRASATDKGGWLTSFRSF
ncbi:uncharacterized protein LOC143219032 [Lasioglossum baleicum]|uniref:uncharacterized protein LOC143219032 n=1 Tax=Lasioglossum baleicum TaxID=434251 RepID=UPI003FCE13D0